MPLTVNTNVASLTAQRSMLTTNSALETSFERLATGKRINSAVDDAAGLAISETLTTSINGLNQAVRNAQDGVSMAQIAEGALAEVSDLLQRMRELSVQANNEVLGTTELGYIKAEVDALVLATTAAIGGAEFAGTALLGSGGNIDIQTGSGATDTTTFTVTNTTTTTLGINALDVTAAGGPATDIGLIDTAIATVNSQRSQLGADQNAFESAIRNAMNVSENTAAARSRILDTDYAAETANLTKNQILQQASTSILAQANQQPQSVLALLQ